MTTRHILLPVFVLFFAFSFTQCKSAPPPTAGGPTEELPKEIAVNLKQVPNTDLLVSVPPVTASTPNATTRGPLPAPKECFRTQTFMSYATYPVTLCSRQPNFGTVVTQYLASTGPTRGPVASADSLQAKTFKLSSLAGRAIDPFLVCHSFGGPWTAIIVKQIDCAGIASCVMTLGCPGCPAFQWFGDTCESTGRPPEVHFFGDLSSAPESISNCPGSLSDCDNGGNPNTNSSPQHPALR